MRFFSNYYLSIALLFFLFLPFLVFAEGDTIRIIVLSTVRPLVNYFLVLLYSLSIIMFLWGLALFVLKSGEEAERAKGKRLIIWGIVALFILGTFNGIVYILSETFFNVDSPRFLPEDAGDFTS